MKNLRFSNSECSLLLRCISKEISRLEKRIDKGHIKEYHIDEYAKLCDLYNYISLSFGIMPLNCDGAFASRAFKMLERNDF